MTSRFSSGGNYRSEQLRNTALSALDILLKGVGAGAMQGGQALRVGYCGWPDDPNGPYSQNDNSYL